MNWPLVSLKAISCLGPQYGANASAVARTGTRPRYVRITDIDSDGRLLADGAVEADLDDDRQFLLEEGDLLFARSGNTVGKVYRHNAANGPCVFAGYLIRFRPAPDLADSRYVFFLTQSAWYKSWVTSRKRVAGQPNVNGAEYSALQFPLPAVKEQRRIVKLLEQADGLRRKRAEADTLADRILPALFHKMFGDPATNPKGFPTRRLRDLAIRYSDGPFGSNLKSDHYVVSGVRVVRLQNIGIGKFLDEDKAFIATEHFGRLSKHECKPGDVLIGTLGDPNLRACIQPKFLAVALNKADCVQFRANPKRCTPEYACWLLNSRSTLAMAGSLIAGQTRSRISMGRLAELVVPEPPLPLQERFSRNVSIVEPALDKMRTAKEDLEKLFATMLHRAFTGELTAKWREAHLKDLLAEMEQQVRLLKSPPED